MNPTPRALDSQLMLAIANKRRLRVSYNGADRVVEPHDYGVQKGIVRVLVYQLSTSAPTGNRSPKGWRLLDVAKIGKLVVLADRFAGSRGADHQRHSDWDVLYARVT